MTGTTDFRKHALVFILLFLASRGLFAAASALDGMDGCGCLALWSRVFAWPAFVAAVIGSLVTGTRAGMKYADECPIGPPVIMLILTFLAGWTAMNDALRLTDPLSAPGWLDSAVLAASVLLAGTLIASIRRDRRGGAIPVARVID